MARMTFAAVAAVLGWVGTLLALVGYWAVSTGRIPGDGVVFQVLNVLGAFGLGVAAVGGRVWSAATLNAVWMGIGITVLARIAARRRVREPDGAAGPSVSR